MLEQAVAHLPIDGLGEFGDYGLERREIVAFRHDAQAVWMLGKINNSMKVRIKEASIKVSAGKENMDDEKIKENIQAVYAGIINALPNKKDNVKNIMIKTTMGKPVKLEIK